MAALPVGLDYTQATAKGDAVEPADVDRVVAHKMFAEAPEHVLRDLLKVFSAEKPDALLLDPWERGGFVAAEAAGVPHGSVILGLRTGTLFGQLPFEVSERERLVEERVRAPDRRLREIAGIPPHDRWLGEGAYDRSLALDMGPPSLQAWPNAWNSHTSHPLRPEPHVSEADSSWLAEVDPAEPLVAVSFGTLFGTPALYRQATEAALATGARVVAVTGYDLGLDHPRLMVRNWVNMPKLLERTSVLMHHGGWGSTIAALASGTPSVVVPLGSDQHVNAHRLAATGASRTVGADSLGDELAPALDRALEDPLLRLNAQRLGTEIAAMPSASEVVPLIERLARDGQPVLRY